MSITDFYAALPIEIISAFALLVMLADALVGRSTKLCATLSVLGFVGAIVSVIVPMVVPVQGWSGTIEGFNGMIHSGGMTAVYDIIFCGAGIIAVLLAGDYLRRVGGMFDEFY